MLAPWHTKSQPRMLVTWKAAFLENYSAVSAWIFNGSSIECHKKNRQPLTLNDWSWGGQWILFPENLNVSQDEVEGNIGIWGKQNSLFPRGPVIKWFVIQQNNTKANFEKHAEIPATTSGHLWSCATAANIAQVPVWCHSFWNVACSWHLAGSSFIIRCQVTM